MTSVIFADDPMVFCKGQAIATGKGSIGSLYLMQCYFPFIAFGFVCVCVCVVGGGGWGEFSILPQSILKEVDKT